MEYNKKKRYFVLIAATAAASAAKNIESRFALAEHNNVIRIHDCGLTL